jgi:hypothetical protein
MKKMKYNDPVFGDVELEHIETFKRIEDDLTIVQKLYEMPSGDFIVFHEMIPANLPNAAFQKEFHIKKEWVDAINIKNQNS